MKLCIVIIERKYCRQKIRDHTRGAHIQCSSQKLSSRVSFKLEQFEGGNISINDYLVCCRSMTHMDKDTDYLSGHKRIPFGSSFFKLALVIFPFIISSVRAFALPGAFDIPWNSISNAKDGDTKETRHAPSMYGPCQYIGPLLFFVPHLQ